MALHTERLILRPPRLEDLTPLARMLADGETARHIGGVQSRHGAWRVLMSVAGKGSLTEEDEYRGGEQPVRCQGPWRACGPRPPSFDAPPIDADVVDAEAIRRICFPVNYFADPDTRPGGVRVIAVRWAAMPRHSHFFGILTDGNADVVTDGSGSDLVS